MERSGLAELSPLDQANMAARSAVFRGVKLGAEFAGTRPLRHQLHTDASAAPTGAKTIYLLRHGQGVHNVWRHAEQAAGRTPTAKRHNRASVPEALHDPQLTPQGLADAAAAADVARQLPPPELCVTSPMRRTASTLLVAFADAIAAGAPVVAHELCREAFHGSDPSLYDSRRGRAELAAAFPQVDFLSHVLPPEPPVIDGGDPVDDPLWWHCASPYGGDGGCVDEAMIGEHAYRFLCWLMARPEGVVAVASHANFLLALHHACLDGCPDAPQVFHTGELRAIAISQSSAPSGVRRAAAGLSPGSQWAAQLTPVALLPEVAATPSTLSALGR